MPSDDRADLPDVLPEAVPVMLPDLPPTLRVTTEQQFKAVSDPLRGRIIQMLRTQPATAKQLADLLGATTGAMGHHLQVLEEAGLVQVVARRLVHGIVAKYYARTARVYIFDLPRETMGAGSMHVVLLTQARDELMEALPTLGPESLCDTFFPHKRLAPERMAVYHQRLNQLVEDFLREQPNPDGVMYSLIISVFRSPTYLQTPIETSPADAEPER
jgi:DNA-binding transcriptional ArsR family regulator